jgi:hypothetical protein
MAFHIEFLVMLGTRKRAEAGRNGVIAARLDADVIGRVRVYQMNLGATEEAVDVLRIAAIAAKQFVPSKQP